MKCLILFSCLFFPLCSHNKFSLKKWPHLNTVVSVHKFEQVSELLLLPEETDEPFLFGYPLDIPLDLIKERNALGPHANEPFTLPNPWLNIAYERTPYIAKMNDCYVDTDACGLVFSRGQKLYHTINKYEVFSDFDLNKPKRNIVHIKKAVHLLQKCSFGYYHFMIEIVSRLTLMLEEIRNNRDLKILLSPPSLPFMREILSLLQISPDQIIFCDPNTIYRVSELYYPRPSYMGYPSAQEINRIRNALITKNQSNADLIIVIDRKESSRHVNNTDDLVKAIKIHFPDNAANIIKFSGGLSVKDQIKLFQSAKIIIGPHGAGFTNMIFSNPNTHSIEFVPEHFLSILYWHISKAIQGDHHHILIENADKESNFNAPIEKVIEILNTII